MKLNDRKIEILKEVISRFIKKAEPVSSQAIVEYCDLDLSSATIRKEMAELEDMELETILQLSSQQLAKITNYLAMIVAPAIYQSKFKHIEVLKFYDNNFLLVLITDTGRVFKGSFTIEGTYNSLDLQSVSNILNSHFRDKNIASIDFKEMNISESYAYLRPL